MDWSSITIRKNQEVAEGQVEDVALLVTWEVEPVEAEVDAVLNSTALFVWQTLDRSDNLRDIASLACESYDVSQEKAQEEIASILSGLAYHKMIFLEDTDGNPISIADYVPVIVGNEAD